MKKFIINIFTPIILLICISSCSTDNRNKTEEQQEHEMALKYSIKKITEFKNTFQFGTGQKEQICRLKIFDENGLKQKEVTYFDGNIESNLTFEYDKNGNLLNINAENPNNSFLYKINRNYYNNNLVKELYYYHEDGTYKYRNFATYDNSNRMIELKYFYPDGLKSVNKYSYRGHKKTEDTEYAPNGEFRYKWIYKYDNRDNLIEAVQYYPNKIINSKITYEYDQSRLLVKQINYFGESIQNIFTLTYNDKKLLSSKTETTSGGMISAQYRYQYEFF